MFGTLVWLRIKNLIRFQKRLDSYIGFILKNLLRIICISKKVLTFINKISSHFFGIFQQINNEKNNIKNQSSQFTKIVIQ